MPVIAQNERLNTIVKELGVILASPLPEKPTQADYYAVMKLKNALKKLPGEVELSEDDEITRQGVAVLAYRRLNEFEDFYEKNSHSWAK